MNKLMRGQAGSKIHREKKYRFPIRQFLIILPNSRGSNVDSASEQTYRTQLQTCMRNLADDDGTDAMKSAGTFLRMGNLLSHLGELSGALRCFHDAFGIRNMKPEKEGEFCFRDFYSVQFTLYVLGKKNREIISVAEGDMIYDLIHDRWNHLMEELESSQFEFVCSDVNQWYASVVIDFPYELCDIFECHSDTINLEEQYN